MINLVRVVMLWRRFENGIIVDNSARAGSKLCYDTRAIRRQMRSTKAVRLAGAVFLTRSYIGRVRRDVLSLSFLCNFLKLFCLTMVALGERAINTTLVTTLISFVN